MRRACPERARTSLRPRPFRLVGWLRQFGYSRRFAGLIFLDVCREEVLRPGRKAYSGCRRDGILEWSFGNTFDRRVAGRSVAVDTELRVTIEVPEVVIVGLFQMSHGHMDGHSVGLGIDGSDSTRQSDGTGR